MAGHVFARSSTAPPLPVAVKGDGPYIIDQNGNQYLDGCCGAAVSCLGHSNQRVAQAISKQLDNIAFAHTGFFTTEVTENLADKLVSLAPENIDRVYFVSGGSEAVESAVKLARQYFQEIGQPKRKHIIARRQSYHGNTLGALAAGGNKARRHLYEPLLIETHHISPCYAYREMLPDETEAEYGRRVANELEEKILEIGTDEVMAFIAEPVVGATLGATPAVEGYFKRIREICNQYGLLLILDEVMCGMGRTGTMFACEQEDISPDIVTIAKGLGAGFQPIGAMLCTNGIHEAVAKGSGSFKHGHTYMGHPMASAAASAVLDEMIENDLMSAVRERGGELLSALKSEFSQHPNIGDIRGRGLFLAMEFVSDRETKEPFSTEFKLPAKLQSTAMKNGLMCYPGSGTIDGVLGDHVLLAPPFIIDRSHIDELIEKLSASINTVLATK